MAHARSAPQEYPIGSAPRYRIEENVNGPNRTLRIGVAGLGRAFTVMLPTFTRDPRIALVAAADPRAEARQRFAQDFSSKTYATLEELCADDAVELVYVATPHQHHAKH